MFNNLVLEYQNKKYIVSGTALDIYKSDKPIMLPDKTTIIITGWLECNPPKPYTLEKVTYRGYVDSYLAIELL